MTDWRELKKFGSYYGKRIVNILVDCLFSPQKNFCQEKEESRNARKVSLLRKTTREERYVERNTGVHSRNYCCLGKQ